MKPLLRWCCLAGTFTLFVVAFGFFDSELTEVRRWVGCGLIVVSMAIALPAMLRLSNDWSRLKPEHDVDLAFLQIMLSLAFLGAAFLLGGNAAALFARLMTPAAKFLPLFTRS